jgi:hypothetical protein
MATRSSSGASQRLSQIPTDLVVKYQAIDIVEVIFSRSGAEHRPNVVPKQKSQWELLSSSEAQ